MLSRDRSRRELLAFIEDYNTGGLRRVDGTRADASYTRT